MSQINIPKSSNHVIPPVNCRGYGFDIEGNPVIVKEDGSIELIGSDNSSTSISNIIANRGVGLYADRPLDPVNNDIYVTSDTFISYVYSDSVLDWIANILVKNQFITNTSTSFKYVFQYDGTQLLPIVFPPDEITGNEIVDLLESLTADDRLDASAIKNLPIEPAAGGFANNLYLSNTASDVVGYKIISYVPDATETIVSASVTSAEGEKTVSTYLYPTAVDISTYPSGLWVFDFFLYLSSANGNTQIGVTYFRRSDAGVETDLFTAWSTEINYTTQVLKTITITNPIFTVDPTDRMGARVKIKTTNTSAITVNYVIGNGYGSWLTTPNRIRHSQLRDFNGDPNYQHITSTEKNKIQLDASGFNGNLSPSDDTFQKIADKVDDLVIIPTTDEENIFFDDIGVAAKVTRAYNFKVTAKTESGGTGTITTSTDAAYTLGNAITANDYVKINASAINTRVYLTVEKVI